MALFKLQIVQDNGCATNKLKWLRTEKETLCVKIPAITQDNEAFLGLPSTNVRLSTTLVVLK